MALDATKWARAPPEEVTAQDDPADTVEDRDTLERIKAALDQLSPDQAEVLRLRLIAGLSAPEVASVVGKTEARCGPCNTVASPHFLDLSAAEPYRSTLT